MLLQILRSYDTQCVLITSGPTYQRSLERKDRKKEVKQAAPSVLLRNQLHYIPSSINHQATKKGELEPGISSFFSS